MRTRWYSQNAALAITYLVAAALSLLTSCDDDEGPSTRDMLIGSWELTEVRIDGIPVDLDGFYLEMEFQSDGDYREMYIEGGTPEIYLGEWELTGNELELDYDDGDRWKLTIISITATTLKVEDEDDFEATLKKNN